MHIIIFILILGLVVLIHEFGHFLAAKKNGIYVEEFGFGFPPRLWGIKIGETRYSINLFPIGGFVKLYGEEYNELSHKKTNSRLLQKSFAHKKPWQKATVIVAGVIGNFLLGWVLISFLFTQGVPVPTNKLIIDQVSRNSPAALAGIKEKDEITQLVINDKKYDLKSFQDLTDLAHNNAGKEIKLRLQRNQQQIEVKLIPRKNPPSGEGPLGVIITSFLEKKYPWYQAPFYGLGEAAKITFQVFSELGKTLIQLISFKKPAVDITGPIGIANYTYQVIKFGNNALLEFIALISLNLAVMNVLPFPALDGGRLAFIIYEWVTKKRVNEKIERNLNLIGFALLMSLALIVSVNDIIKLIKFK